MSGTKLCYRGSCNEHLPRIRDWGNQYGGVFSLKFGSNNVIVLCDKRAVHELVDKKGLLYADRPHSYIGELLTLGDHMVVSSGDPLTRLKRKVATHNLSVRVPFSFLVDGLLIVDIPYQPRVIDVKLAPIQESEYVKPVPSPRSGTNLKRCGLG